MLCAQYPNMSLVRLKWAHPSSTMGPPTPDKEGPDQDILTSPHLVRFTPNYGRSAAHPYPHLAVGYEYTP
jgi:hypothetical protein